MEKHHSEAFGTFYALVDVIKANLIGRGNISEGTRWEFYRPYVAFLFAVLVYAWCSTGPKILPLLQTDKFHATYDVALVSFQTSPMPDNHSVP